MWSEIAFHPKTAGLKYWILTCYTTYSLLLLAFTTYYITNIFTV